MILNECLKEQRSCLVDVDEDRIAVHLFADALEKKITRMLEKHIGVCPQTNS